MFILHHYIQTIFTNTLQREKIDKHFVVMSFFEFMCETVFLQDLASISYPLTLDATAEILQH